MTAELSRPHPSLWATCASELGVRSIMTTALRTPDRLLGTVLVYSTDRCAYRDGDADMLLMFAHGSPAHRHIHVGVSRRANCVILNVMRAFRQAVEARDTQAMEALLADDVVFTSPVAFKPYPGKAITAAILRGVMRVFQDFRYVREINDPDGHHHALMFEATVAGKKLTGCDFLHVDDDGLIDEFIVMVRPLSGATALADAMGAQFERIEREATTGQA